MYIGKQVFVYGNRNTQFYFNKFNKPQVTNYNIKQYAQMVTWNNTYNY